MPFSVITICEFCNTKNRVPAGHLADTGQCGACKKPLRPVHTPISVDTNGFDEVISAVKVPVLVDFWASWCGPCRMAAPEVEKLARETEGKAVVLKVDTDANPQLSGRFHITSIPTFMVFMDGRKVLERPGVAPASEMRKWLEQARSVAPTA